MLVLTRSTNQSIMIGPDIVVTVLEVRGDNVRLGIQAAEISRRLPTRSHRAARSCQQRRMFSESGGAPFVQSAAQRASCSRGVAALIASWLPVHAAIRADAVRMTTPHWAK